MSARAKFLLFGLICLATVALHAAIIWFGALQTVNNTNAVSMSGTVGQFLAPAQNFYITNTGLTQTSALTVLQRFSLDGTNWTTNFTWNPPATNPGTYTMTAPGGSITVYQDLVAVTTNNVSLGVTQ